MQEYQKESIVANLLDKMTNCILQSQNDSCHTAKHDDEDGAEAIDLLRNEGKQEDEDAEAEPPRVLAQRTKVLAVHQKQCGGCKQTHNGWSQSIEDVLHRRMAPVFHQELADKKHKDEARQHNRKSGKKAPQDAPIRRVTGIDQSRVTNVCGAVDADWSGGALADGNNIGELSHRHPMIMPDDLALYHRNHGISPTETEKADKEECPKELCKEQYHKNEELRVNNLLP